MRRMVKYAVLLQRQIQRRFHEAAQRDTLPIMWDPTAWSNAAHDADQGMLVPEGLMSFASDGRGKPSRQQRTLYLGAIAFTYAVWENYVEDLAVELSAVAADVIDEAYVPPKIQGLITSGATTWQLTVHPGWRGLWRERVIALAKGDGSSAWGLNTASARNVRALFDALAIDPLPERLDVLNLGGKPPSGNYVRTRDKTVDVSTMLDLLVSIRGEAVHTAQTSETLLKAEVLWWRDFVRSLYHQTDETARRHLCDDLLKIDFQAPTR